MSDNFGRNRNTVIIGLVVAILAIVLLATTLLNSGWDTLSPSAPISYQSEVPELNINPQIPSLHLPLAAFMLLIIVLSIIAVLRYPAYTLRMIVISGMMVTLISFFLERLPVVEPSGESAASEVATLEELAQGSALETVAIEAAPTWINNATALVISLVLAAIVIPVLLYLFRPQPEVEPLPTMAIADQAKQTIKHIESGFDLRNAILNCYAQMLNTVHQSRGIMRRAAMTAHEFETELIKLGLPASSVKRLTQLFETVRYGGENPGIREQREAYDCLNEIVAAIEK